MNNRIMEKFQRGRILELEKLPLFFVILSILTFYIKLVTLNSRRNIVEKWFSHYVFK